MLTDFPLSPWKTSRKSNFQPSDSVYKTPKAKNIAFDRYLPNKIPSHIFDYLLKDNQETSITKNIVSNPIENDLNEEFNYNDINQILIKDQNQYNYASILEKNIVDIENIEQQTISHKENSIFKYKKTYHQKKMNNLMLSYNPFDTLIPSYFHFKTLETPLRSTIRKISNTAYKILDAPNLQDDFYLNLLDWSNQNQIGIGLENILYTWSPTTFQTNKIFEISPEELITSVSFSPNNTISMGDTTGIVRIFDIETSKRISSIKIHKSRVSSLAWNGNLLTMGSRDKTVSILDTRYLKQEHNFPLFSLKSHSQEVCGTKWSFDSETLATGGNDNKIFLWNLKMMQKEIAQFTEHKAAVKALAWSPHNVNLLASGGGTNDKTIKFWNTQNFKLINSIETGSQVCNMIFSNNVDELVSTHGFLLNQIFVWKYPQMQKVATLSGHKQRILYLALSPKGEDIVTGAGDDTLRFWKVFPTKKNQMVRSYSKIDVMNELR